MSGHRAIARNSFIAFEITVGPLRLAINQGYGVLITEQDGQIRWPTDNADGEP
jgi:hypothetical protein